MSHTTESQPSGTVRTKEEINEAAIQEAFKRKINFNLPQSWSVGFEVGANWAFDELNGQTVELRKELSDTKANLGRAYDGVNYWKPLAEKQRDELTSTRSLLDRMAEAGNELTHLHACEQEGLASGKPTFKQWVEAVDKLNTVLTEYQSMKQ